MASSVPNEDEKTPVHPLLDGKYFKIKEQTGMKLKCTCTLCGQSLSAAVNATTNLYTHIKVSNISVIIRFINGLVFYFKLHFSD